MDSGSSGNSSNGNGYTPGTAATLNRVRNLTSSIAGAGSNEVHMFRQRREMETIRLKKMDRELDARTDKVLFEEKRAENVMKDQQKTDKKRNKRQRKKEAKKSAKAKEKAQKRAADSALDSSDVPKEKRSKTGTEQGVPEKADDK